MLENIILMADVIGSRNLDQNLLYVGLKQLVMEINSDCRDILLSPLTITLGDEFQGVARDLTAALEIIVNIEEMLISKGKGFKFRYVVVEGTINTPINPEIAYGMLGEGLTKARDYITAFKDSRLRFHFYLNSNKKAEALNNLFIIYQDYIDAWNIEKDYKIAGELIKYRDYKKVAEITHMSRSQIWKKEKTLKMEQYNAVKNIILAG